MQRVCVCVREKGKEGLSALHCAGQRKGQARQELEIEVAYPESVLPGTLEQLDHLERIPLLQDDRDSSLVPFSSSCTVAFELLSRVSFVSQGGKKNMTETNQSQTP